MKNETKQFFAALALSLTLICAGYLSGKAQTGQPDSVKTVQTCKGTTKAQNPCKSTFIVKGTDYCNSHQVNAIKCAGLNAKKEKCGNSVKVAGSFCRFHAN